MLYGAQAFVPQPCRSCGAVIRARSEIGGYLLGALAGRSGLSAIFHATDSTGVPVAVKLVQAPLTAGPRDIEYFVSEVWALARLNHPNSVRIFAAGVEKGMAWIAMEWLAEGSLAQRIATRGRLREAEVLIFGAQAAAALGAAFAAGHMHRAIAPNNLVFADSRTVKITDFANAALYQLIANDMGTMWGRAWYASPERFRNEHEEAHADIYSLGTTLFHALAGTPLHGGEPYGLLVLEAIENEEMHVEQLVPGLHERTVRTLNRMLAPEAEQGFQNWNEVVSELSQAAAQVARRDAIAISEQPGRAKPTSPSTKPAPKPAQPRRAWAVVVVLLLAMVAAIALFKHRQSAAQKASMPVAVVLPTPEPKPATPEPVKPASEKPVAKIQAAFDWSGWAAVGLGRSGAKINPEILPQGGALRLSSSGSGIAPDREELGFYQCTLEGDWTFTARVGVHDGPAGLGVRDRTGDSRPALTVWLAAENAVSAAVRRKPGAKSELIVPVPVLKASWLRLTRRGGNFTAECSADGKQWKPLPTGKLPGMPAGSPLSVGLVVWSGTSERAASAIFDEVSVSRGK